MGTVRSKSLIRQALVDWGMRPADADAVTSSLPDDSGNDTGGSITSSSSNSSDDIGGGGSYVTSHRRQSPFAPTVPGAAGGGAAADNAPANEKPVEAVHAPAAVPGLGEHVPQRLRELLALNLQYQPLVQRYVTLLERPVRHMGAAILTAAVVQHILQGARLRGPLAEAQKPAAEYGLGILMDAGPAEPFQRSVFSNAALRLRGAHHAQPLGDFSRSALR